MNQPTQPAKPPIVRPWMLILLIVVIIAAVLVYFFYIKKSPTTTSTTISPTPTVSITTSPSVSSSVPATATPVTWQTYTNPRINYSFEYPVSGLAQALEELEKYNASDPNSFDLVTFSTSDTSYSVRTDFSGHVTTVDAWITGGLGPVGFGFPSFNLSDYTKTTVAGITAYTYNDGLTTFFVDGTKYFTIEARSGTQLKTTSDTNYSHLLSSFKLL